MVRNAKDVTFDDVTIHSHPGMGIVGHRCESVAMTGLKIVPRPGMLMSTNTDATHFTSCTGTVTIDNCEFYNAEYVSTYEYYSYSYDLYIYVNAYYTDATGLYLNMADPNITDCTFRNNGLASSALKWWSPSYSNNGVMTWGRGIMALESSPNITRCTFQLNGEQPPDRMVGGTNQVFFDRFFWDEIPEGGLLCVGSQAHPSIWNSRFITNEVFGIYGMGGGYPKLVDGCQITGTRFVREMSPGQWTVFSPSAGIQADEGGGTMVVANCTANSNSVLANIYMMGPTLHLINFTNSGNVVTNAWNIVVSDGKHRFEHCFLDGRPALDRNVYV